MDLLTNAIESIQVGVADYQTGTRPRLLSAVRNIHAGVLLLYKEALLRRSPPGTNEALIKAKVEPRADAAGALTYVGVGRKTVEIQQIRERFKSLNVTTDWTLLDGITEVRNDVEHYYPRVTQDALRGVIASAFVIIRDFAARELDEEPRDLLGQETWDAMLGAAAVHGAERRDCDSAVEAFEWGSDTLADGVARLRCADCGSDLMRPADLSAHFSDVVLECRACGATHAADAVIPDAVAESLMGEAYLAMSDGGDEPYGDCPYCSSASYVFAEGRCAACGESAATECDRCGNTIPPSEIASSPLCGYCEHVTTKDD